MTSEFFFIFFLSALTCVHTEISLSISAPAIVKPTQSMKMTCHVSGVLITDGSKMHAVNFVRQFAGNKMEFLAHLNYAQGTAYNPAIQSRLSLSRDTAKNEVHLEFKSLETTDSATYYCASEKPGRELPAMDIWGSGTPVTVTQAQPQAPNVYPLVPCCNFESSLQEVPIGCLTNNYLPRPVEVEWNEGLITSGISNLPAVLTSSGNYMSTSFLTVPVSNFKSSKYTCNVNHKPTNTKINVEISDQCEKTSLSPPNVKVTQASCGETGSVDLICLIDGYSPDDIKIQWLLNGNPTSITPKNTPSSKDNEGHFESRSQVSVPKVDWNSGDTYTCKVSHPPSNTKKEDNIHKCSESSALQPKVVLLPPSPKDLLITKEPKITCVVSKLSFTDSLNFKWKRADGKRTQVFKSEPKQEYDGTYSVTSSLRVSLTDWASGGGFTCIVEHSDFPSPIEKTIQHRDEPTTEPTIYLFPPPAAELAKFEFVGITCLIKRFTPQNVYVQWKKNGVVIEEDQYINTVPILDEDTETYIMYSTLFIEKSEWNRGATYTCACVLDTITSADIKKNRGK